MTHAGAGKQVLGLMAEGLRNGNGRVKEQVRKEQMRGKRVCAGGCNLLAVPPRQRCVCHFPQAAACLPFHAGNGPAGGLLSSPGYQLMP